VTKITFEKITRSEPKKVFDIISNFENYEKLLPNYYLSVRIKSVRDESSLVAEHLKLHDKEFVIMAKHFNDSPYRHEMRVIGGDIKGSYIIEKIIPFESETKIIVEAKINTGKRFSILKNANYKKALEDLYDEILTIIESR
jgi:coenzyme Q-binding protein COQ10